MSPTPRTVMVAVLLLVTAILSGIGGAIATMVLLAPEPAPPASAPSRAPEIDSELLRALVAEALAETGAGAEQETAAPEDLAATVRHLESRLEQVAQQADRAAARVDATESQLEETRAHLREVLPARGARELDPDATNGRQPHVEPLLGTRSAEFRRDPGASFSVDGDRVQSLSVGGGPTEGDLDANDGQVVGGGRDGAYAESYVFAAVAGITYQIDVYSPDGEEEESFDTYMALFDPEGNLIGTDDDGGGGLNSRMLFTAETTGNHRVTVTSYSAGEEGHFEVSVQERPDGSADPTSPGTEVRDITAVSLYIGGEAQGMLDEHDGRLYEDGALRGFADGYRFNAARGERVVIDLTSESIDMYLALFTDDGVLIATDDDGGGGTNSRIAFTAPASGHYLAVTSSFSEGTTGPYRIWIHLPE